MAQEISEVERDRRALEIFVQACGLAPSERTALIAELCGDDAGVLKRVEAMLKADESGADRAVVGTEGDVNHFMTRQIRGLAPEDPADEAGLPAADAAPAAADEYTIIRVIGEGGMGTVYEAEQHHPRRRVAIKAIRPGRISPAMSKRFEYEAQVLARLEHPGIARLYESNAETRDGHIRAYLAMELVDGVSIDAYCASKNLSPVHRIRLFMKVCDAVSYAHRMGIIHRDLKPANILVNTDGQPKILDFGVARTIEQQGGQDAVTLLTEHGQILGTLGYMSPEQVEGKGDVDTRADVYSLGVILYRLLTGQLPIDVGNDSLVAATQRILTETPTRIGHHDRRFKGDLEIVVCKALEKDPARRYASVDQLRDELERYLDGRPIEARADSTLYVFRKAVWRHRGSVGIGLLLLAMLTTFGIVAAFQAKRNRSLADDANEQQRIAVLAKNEATEKAETLRRQLYFSQIGFAQAALENNDSERAYRLLDDCEKNLLQWEWYYLQRLRDLSNSSVELGVERPRYASYSLDRSRLALASLDREVALVDPNNDYRDVLREHLADGTARATVSPDGRWFAFGGEIDRVILVELATGARRTLAVPSPAVRDVRRTGLRLLQFTADSKTLVTGGTDQFVRVWNVSTAATPPRLTIPLGEPAQPICLLLARDGAWATIGDSRGGLRMFDLRTGNLLRAFGGHEAAVWSLALSADGKQFASGDNNARVNIWDASSGAELHRFDPTDGWVTAMAFSPDGTWLAVGRSDSNVNLFELDGSSTPRGVLRGHRHAIVHIDWYEQNKLHTISLDGALKNWDADSALQVPTIKTEQPESIGLAFDPAGEHVYVGGSDGTVRSWKVTGEDALHPTLARQLESHQASVLEVTIDRTTGRIASAGRDGVIRITSPDETQPPLVLNPGTGLVSSIDFSPDGKQLLVGTDGEISLWDAHAGTRLRNYTQAKIVANELRFDRTGTHFYGACVDGHVRRWGVESHEPIAATMVDSHGLYDVQLSPDGKHVLVAGDTQCVALLEADTLKEVGRYVGHQGVVLGVAFHPSGRRIASGGADGSIRVWDVDTAAELISLRGHTRRIEHVAFSPDGETLASSSDDGTVKLWQTTQGSHAHADTAK